MQAVALRRAVFTARAWPLRCASQTTPALKWARSLATEAASGPAVTATNRAEATLKRFWKNVEIEQKDGRLVITLDKKALKTPSGNKLLVPETKPLVAALIAAEWENQDTLLKQYSLPMTSLAARAIDEFQAKATQREIGAELIRYLATDSICFLSSEPKALTELQEKHWTPIREWVINTFSVELSTATDSFTLKEHPKETIDRLSEVLSTFDEWQMAAMERATRSSKSFLIGLALTLRHITAEQAASATNVEVDSQIDKWGMVEDSHDVDYHDIRRQLASAACLLSTL